MIHFWTNDLDATISYYTETLGFSVTHLQPTEHPHDFCILKLGEHQVMFGIPPTELIQSSRPDKALLELMLSRIGQAGPMAIYVSVPDIDKHYAHAVESGAEILEPLWDTPWGLRQYSLRDIDGHALTFHSG